MQIASQLRFAARIELTGGFYARLRISLSLATLVLGLALAPAYAAPASDTQLSGVHLAMLKEFSDRSIGNDERYGRLKKHYAGVAETLGDTEAASNSTLQTAFSMSEAMLVAELGYSQPSPQRYVADMSAVFDELSRRGVASSEQRNSMIGAHLSVWQIAQAKALASKETRIKEGEVFALERGKAFEPTAPAVVSVSATGDIARAMPFVFPQGPTVVVSAGCHVARRAAEAISKDAQLREVFRGANAIWLSPASTTVDPISIVEWNKHFPDAQMHIAFDNSKWTGVDFARLPSFHFYLDGKLVTRINGWSDEVTMRKRIWDALESIGVDARREKGASALSD